MALLLQVLVCLTPLLRAQEPPDLPAGQPILSLALATRGSINALLFSPDGKTLVTAGANHEIMLWDVQTGEWVRSLLGHHNSVTALCYAPDGTTLASASLDGTIRLWNVQTGALLRTLEDDKAPESNVAGAGMAQLAFAPDGKLLAVAYYEGTVKLWDVPHGAVLHTLPGATRFRSVMRFTPDGKTVFVSGSNGPLQALDVDAGTWRPDFNLDTKPGVPVASALSGDGKFALLNPSNQGRLQLWNTQTQQLVAPIIAPNETGAFAFSTNGGTLVGAVAPGLLVFWNTDKGEITQAINVGLEMNSRAITQVAMSPDGKLVAAANQEGTLKVWEVKSTTLKTTQRGYKVSALSALWTPDGKNFIGGYSDGSLRIWDATTGKLQKTLDNPGHQVIALALGADGHTLAVAFGWQSFTYTMETRGIAFSELQIWDTRRWTLAQTIKQFGHDTGIAALAIAPTGTMLATASERRVVTLWDIKTGQATQTLDGMTGSSPALAFAPNGKLLALGSDQGLQLWKMPDGTPAGDSRAQYDYQSGQRMQIAFAPDGARIATSSAVWSVRFWDVATKKWQPMLDPAHTPARAIAFAPDGRILASRSGAANSKINLWDATSGKLLRAIETKLTLTTLAFAPDAKSLLAAAGDGTLRLFNVATGRLMATLALLPPTATGEPNNWISFTPTGAYESSAGAAPFMRWETAQQLLPAAAYARQFHRPDLVQSALQGGK